MTSSPARGRTDGGAADEAAPLLRLRGVSKSFGPVRALVDVDLDVRAGEVVALCGENGSGKSTLSKVVAGVLQPDAGVVEVDGSRCTFSRPKDALEVGVAMVAQEPTSVPSMSVAENVLLTRLQHLTQRVRRGSMAADAQPFLERVGLGHLDPDMPLAALGQGSRELVEVAKALVSEPRLLILDEVTTRLPDPEHLFGVVDRLAAEGMAVLFITHRLREIRRLAHRAVVLRDGHRTADLARDELGDDAITRAMVGRPLADFYGKRDVPLGDVVLELDGLVTERSPHPVSLQVRAGEVVGLAGLVGAGRSEVLETVAGVRRARGGAVRVGGHEVSAGNPKASLEAGVSLVPEDRYRQALVRPATITRNVSMPFHRFLRRTDTPSEHTRASHAVEAFAIRCAGVDAPVGSLSGGNAQKVVFARCLALAPKVLLLDEPTRGVDVGARAEIYDMLGDLVEQGLGILVASSDLPELLGLCDRVVVLHDGELVGAVADEDMTEEAVALLSVGGSRSAA